MLVFIQISPVFGDPGALPERVTVAFTLGSYPEAKVHEAEIFNLLAAINILPPFTALAAFDVKTEVAIDPVVINAAFKLPVVIHWLQVFLEQKH